MGTGTSVNNLTASLTRQPSTNLPHGPIWREYPAREKQQWQNLHNFKITKTQINMYVLQQLLKQNIKVYNRNT